MSAICTYEGCSIRPIVENSALGDHASCPCCGSLFGLDGVPFEGPATKPLPFFALQLSADQILEIDLAQHDADDPYVRQSGTGISNRLYFDAAANQMTTGPAVSDLTR